MSNATITIRTERIAPPFQALRFRMRWRALIVLIWLSAIAGCSVVTTAKPPALAANVTWVMLPIANYTDTPQAGLRAEAITESLMVAAGRRVIRYPLELRADGAFEPADKKAPDAAMAWARKSDATYALVGAVDEWRYKVGIDGEPAVGIAFSIIELSTGKTIWSATGARSGWSREALSAVAQKLIQRLLKDVAPT
jgi:polysaccharide biosynthesis protein PelC